MLKAGFARLDMTPPLGSPMAGYFEYREAEGILDPLELNALAVSDGENTVVIVTADILMTNEIFATNVEKPKFGWLKWLLALLPPVVLSILFEVLKYDTVTMALWVHGYLAPVIQTIGKLWSFLPFSVAEVIIALAVAALILWPLRAVVLLVKQRRVWDFLRRIFAMSCAMLWAWGLFCWSWNCTYYATGFASRNGLSKAPYTPEQLLQVTVYFACAAAELSDDVPRNEDNSFALSTRECFERGVTVYDNLSLQFDRARQAAITQEITEIVAGS